MSFWQWFQRKFHSHEWVVEEKLPLTVRMSKDGSHAKGLRFVLRCKICGKIEHKDIY